MRRICSRLAGILIVLLISLMSSCSSMNAPYVEFNRLGFSIQMGLNARSDPVQHSPRRCAPGLGVRFSEQCFQRTCGKHDRENLEGRSR